MRQKDSLQLWIIREILEILSNESRILSLSPKQYLLSGSSLPRVRHSLGQCPELHDMFNVLFTKKNWPEICHHDPCDPDENNCFYICDMLVLNLKCTNICFWTFHPEFVFNLGVGSISVGFLQHRIGLLGVNAHTLNSVRIGIEYGTIVLQLELLCYQFKVGGSLR
jgi:hypothetical protein